MWFVGNNFYLLPEKSVFFGEMILVWKKLLDKEGMVFKFCKFWGFWLYSIRIIRLVQVLLTGWYRFKLEFKLEFGTVPTFNFSNPKSNDVSNNSSNVNWLRRYYYFLRLRFWFPVLQYHLWHMLCIGTNYIGGIEIKICFLGSTYHMWFDKSIRQGKIAIIHYDRGNIQ